MSDYPTIILALNLDNDIAGRKQVLREFRAANGLPPETTECIGKYSPALYHQLRQLVQDRGHIFDPDVLVAICEIHERIHKAIEERSARYEEAMNHPVNAGLWPSDREFVYDDSLDDHDAVDCWAGGNELRFFLRELEQHLFESVCITLRGGPVEGYLELHAPSCRCNERE